MAKLCFSIAFRIWGTDARDPFRDYPFGPPSRWFWPRIAWELYHLGIRLEAKANG